MKKQQKEDIFYTILSIIVLIVFGYFLFGMFLEADERVARADCQYWKEQLEVNPYFYLTDWQEEMCKELGEL